MTKYNLIKPVGEGTYGKVFLAKEEITGDVVAVKTVVIDQEIGISPNTIKEISILKTLNHERIIKLYDVVHVGSKIQLVLEFVDIDMHEYLRNRLYTDEGVVPAPVCRSLMQQLIKGVEYLHSHSIIHRDVKPANLLINKRGELKIADFGLARVMDLPEMELETNVVTLWYRCPELLMNGKTYDMGVDVWSIGCIMAEMMGGIAVFRGNSEISVLRAIFFLLGAPSSEERRAIRRDYPSMRSYSIPVYAERNFSEHFPYWTPLSLDLLAKMLTFFPQNRPSCADLLTHSYFVDGPLVGDLNESGAYTLQEAKQMAQIAARKEERRLEALAAAEAAAARVTSKALARRRLSTSSSSKRSRQ